MKRLTLLVGFLVALVFLGAVSAPTVSAQALDGYWVKCKVKAKGYAVDLATGVYTKHSESPTAYLHFVWGGAIYAVAVWTLKDNVWENTSNTNKNSNHPGENFFVDWSMNFVLSSTDNFHGFHTAFVAIKNGKVKYQGSGEVTGGSVLGGQTFYGSYSITGTSVAADKLPFTP
jgi:hypothetical protein